ncbi:MAG: helix-turn-helix domain-containing protein [Candidatus Riflebacteria bacterium]|nr:helix-turn-helix domain-containing protein [Candidatus Riflebacteria bacterium]
MIKDYQDSTGNVFLDLGYSLEDAELLRLRADLMAAVRKWISENRLTPHEAAEILHVSQPRITDLQRGKWDRFSLEKLIVLAIRSGFKLAVSRTV